MLDWIDEYIPHAAMGLCVLWFILSLITGEGPVVLALLAFTGWAAALHERNKRKKQQVQQVQEKA